MNPKSNGKRQTPEEKWLPPPAHGPVADVIPLEHDHVLVTQLLEMTNSKVLLLMGEEPREPKEAPRLRHLEV